MTRGDRCACGRFAALPHGMAQIKDGVFHAPVGSTLEPCCEAAIRRAAPDLYRELSLIVRLLEPMEASGGLSIPGLATLNGPRRALARARGEE